MEVNRCKNNYDNSVNNDKQTIADIRDISLFSKTILNDLVFEKIRGFLDNKNRDVNNLLKGSRNFKMMKMAKFHWKLNYEYSWKYYIDNSFKSNLNSLLTNTRTHLSLNLSQRMGLTNVNTLNNIHALDLRRCFNLSNVSALNNVHILLLSGCNKLRDVSTLGNTHTLDLSRIWAIKITSHLCNVYDLDITGCGGVKNADIRGLTNVHRLNLSECTDITDVSNLTNVHTLDLHECYRIKDISALVNVHILNHTYDPDWNGYEIHDAYDFCYGDYDDSNDRNTDCDFNRYDYE
jgi:hypothetical protein